MNDTTRRASGDDAERISDVIIAYLRVTNSQDYSEAVIARVEQSFSPSAVSALLTRHIVFAAVDRGNVIGTASLEDGVIRTVFVDPRYQRRGVGRALMAAVEGVAAQQGYEASLFLLRSPPRRSTPSWASGRSATAFTVARNGPS